MNRRTFLTAMAASPLAALLPKKKVVPAYHPAYVIDSMTTWQEHMMREIIDSNMNRMRRDVVISMIHAKNYDMSEEMWHKACTKYWEVPDA